MHAFISSKQIIAPQTYVAVIRQGLRIIGEPAILGLISIFLCLSTCADAQTNRTTTIAEDASICEQAIINGKPMKAIDIEGFANMLELEKLKKDEFESTPSHLKRTSEVIAKIEQHLKYVTGWPLIVAAENPNPKANYDADKKQLIYEFKYSYPYITWTIPKPLDFSKSLEEQNKTRYLREELIEVSRQSEPVGNYTASNAFGATVEVSAFKTKLVGISLGPGKGFGPPKPIKIGISASPEEAKRLKNESQIIYVAKLVSPFYRKERDLASPTLQSPTQVETDYVSLVGNLLCAALFDPANKKILSTLPLK